MISLSIVSCAKKKDKAFSDSENIEVPDAPKTGDIIKTYSGTFHLKATLNEKESDCSLEAETEEEQIKKQKDFFEKIKTIKDTLNCEQANEAFQCQSVSYSELLFKGNIKKEAFELKLDKQRLSYVKDIDFGKNALITTILKGSFYSADLAREGKMVNVNQVMQKNIIRAGKKCSLAWDFDLYRDKNSQTSEKPPVIKSITIKQNEKSIDVTSEITDEDSGDKVEVFTIYFEKDKAPAKDKIDWSKATKGKSGDPYTINDAKDGVTYIIYVKAVDEGGNQAISSKEHTFKKPVVAGSDAATGGGATPATGGAGVTGNDGVAKPAATTITITGDEVENLQKFVTELCQLNSSSIDTHELFQELCAFSFDSNNVQFVSSKTSNGKIHVLLVSKYQLLLGDQDIKKIPESIGTLKKLKEIVIYDSPLESLPETIGELTSLEKLILNNNKLTTLPTSIEKLTQLKELDLQYNPIKPNEKIRLNKLFGSKVKIKNR